MRLGFDRLSFVFIENRGRREDGDTDGVGGGYGEELAIGGDGKLADPFADWDIKYLTI